MRRSFYLALITLALLPGMDRLLAQSAARQAGYLYLSPVPGASYVSDQTRYVLVRLDGVSPWQATNLLAGFVTVTGASSGEHSGSTRVASDGRTVIFEMEMPFTQGELVTVSLNPMFEPDQNWAVQSFQYQFMVTAPMPSSLPLTLVENPPPLTITDSNSVTTDSVQPKETTTSTAIIKSNGVSVPSDFPAVVITANNNPSPGYLFLEPGTSYTKLYTMILDNNGNPVWYRRGRLYDFKIQKNNTITWCQDPSSGGFTAMDLNFNYLGTYVTTNGYTTDGHELKVLEDGSYFMIGYRTNLVDLSHYIVGGNPTAIGTETVVQGFTAAGDLILQWRSWDNYDIRDQLPNTELTHMNAIDVDDDGNVLVSARHQSEITKFNRDTGEVIWRLGGAHNSFTYKNDPLNGTSWQHNISALGNGHYLMFDNGNYHSPALSRAVEYQLDLTQMTATLVWQFRDTPDKYSYWQGSAERLPTGNTLINFVRASYPKATEVDTNGVKRFELSLVPSGDNYRTFRLPWTGMVATPYLIAEQSADKLTLIFNKFGDTNVAFYRVYWGTAPEPTEVLAESSATLFRMPLPKNGDYHFRVTAVNNEGAESDFSNEEEVLVNATSPGQNMLANGSFSTSTNSWTLSVSGLASANWDAASGTGEIYIANAGSQVSDIQLLQGPLRMVQGQSYVLAFDAWSAAPRYLQTLVGLRVSPWTSYELTTSYLIPKRQHYSYNFVMQNPTDQYARLSFELGASSATVYLANVSLYAVAPGDFNRDGLVDPNDLSVFTGQWLRPGTGLPGDLNGDGKVDFADFAIFAKSWSGAAQ